MEPIFWPLSAQNRWKFVCPKGTVTYTFPLNIHHEGISPDAKRHDQPGYMTPDWIVNLNSSSLDETNWKERDLSSSKQIIGCYKWPECPLAHYHKGWCCPNGSSFKFVMSLWRRLSYLWIAQNTETFFSKSKYMSWMGAPMRPGDHWSTEDFRTWWPTTFREITSSP